MYRGDKESIFNWGFDGAEIAKSRNMLQVVKKTDPCIQRSKKTLRDFRSACASTYKTPPLSKKSESVTR